MNTTPRRFTKEGEDLLRRGWVAVGVAEPPRDELSWPHTRDELNAHREQFARDAALLRALAVEVAVMIEGEVEGEGTLARGECWMDSPRAIRDRLLAAAERCEYWALPHGAKVAGLGSGYGDPTKSWLDANGLLWSERPKPTPLSRWWDRVSEALVGPLVFLMFAAGALLIIFVGVSCGGSDHDDRDADGNYNGRYDDVGGSGMGYDDVDTLGRYDDVGGTTITDDDGTTRRAGSSTTITDLDGNTITPDETFYTRVDDGG